MMMLWMCEPEYEEVDDKNIIQLDERRTVKVQVEEELEVVGEAEEAPKPRQQKPRRAGTMTLAEQVEAWKQKNASREVQHGSAPSGG